MALDTYVAPALLTSGATWAQLVAAGLDGMVALLAAANPAITPPTVQATVSVSAGGNSGGLLAAGAYYATYTWCDGAGETTDGTAHAAESAVWTVVTAHQPVITVPALPSGACSYNVYLTAVSGAAATETLYMTGCTTTTTTLALAAPAPIQQTVPTKNTTGTATLQSLLQQPIPNLLQKFWDRSTIDVDNYISGRPVDFQTQRMLLQHRDYALAFWHQLMVDINVLVAANKGTIHYSQAGALVLPVPYRSFP